MPKQLHFAFFTPPGTVAKTGRTVLKIPMPASLQVFRDVWADYSMFIETSHVDTEATHFCMDVQKCLSRIYPDKDARDQAEALLIAKPFARPATRAALGAHFLSAGLWPVKNYFTK